MALETVSGKQLCPIGIGTWMMGGSFDEVSRISTPDYQSDQLEIDAIKHSLGIGQNHIDTAEMYGDGHTDEIVGRAIEGFDRSDLYIADKLWRNSLGKTETNDAVERMLKRLDTDYIDLLYIHSTFGDSSWERAIDPINELISRGVVRHFGVSNFSVEDMERASDLSDFKISANQVHFNCMHKNDADDVFLNYCEEKAIEVVAYQPVERGSLLENPVIRRVAEKHSATPAQVSIAWLVQRGRHAIPKASKIAHIDDNFEALNVALDDSDFELLDAV